MAHCLDNYIGLRGCGSTTPPSGLYVNDLPGMSLENLVTLTNTDEPTYTDIWTMVQTRAQQRFSLDVREAMGKHYKLNSLMQGINVGNDVGSLAASTPAQYAGFTIELIDQNYDFVPSPFASIHVQQIVFFADQIYNGAQFDIVDLDSGLTLHCCTYIDIFISNVSYRFRITDDIARLLVSESIYLNK